MFTPEKCSLEEHETVSYSLLAENVRRELSIGHEERRNYLTHH